MLIDYWHREQSGDDLLRGFTTDRKGSTSYFDGKSISDVHLLSFPLQVVVNTVRREPDVSDSMLQ